MKQKRQLTAFEHAHREAFKVAFAEGVAMVVTISPNDATGQPEFGWCRKDQFEILHGPLAKTGQARIVEEISV